MSADHNNLAFWFSQLRKTDVPVPKTRIVEALLDLSPMIDGKRPRGLKSFLDALTRAGNEVGGFPIFLRTGYGSGKHEWKETCYVEDPTRLGRHVQALVEWSCTVDLMGLPFDTWVVREFLPTSPAFHAFGGMPITRERRYFVEGGQVVCHHPYWPEEAILSPSSPDWNHQLVQLNRESPFEVETLTKMSVRVSRAVLGAWSLDWLCTDRGWYAIDMATAGRSWHWPGCDARRKESSS